MGFSDATNASLEEASMGAIAAIDRCIPACTAPSDHEAVDTSARAPVVSARPASANAIALDDMAALAYKSNLPRRA